MFCVADRVRPEARIAVVTTLISDDECNVMMMTGDDLPPAESVRSQFLPEDKLHFISSM
jgi:cation transport ATPase